ncbi:hypothetical protein GCM10011340_33290 [Roseivirga thermotolerans]|uniref:Uncharacterized protein n=1 Tax=Roseivirga thermotolerans TaxID=1758176 RepID=A0ABQ3IC20_9BACT|nr:hypothetical protein GCM10011340_33290 [Roseivirga thermotolerans]
MKSTTLLLSLSLFILWLSNSNLFAQSSNPEPWLASSEYSLVWAYTSLDSIERHGCCVESSEDNACNLTVQTDQSLCKAGRTIGFMKIWDIETK